MEIEHNNHTPVILIFLLDVGEFPYRRLGPILIDEVSKLEVDDCAVLFNNQDSFSTAKGYAVAALSDFKPFEIKLSQCVQVLVNSIGSFDLATAKRVLVIAEEFKQVDEFKIKMAMEKNQRENENSIFYFVSIDKPSTYLKELADQGQCHYHQASLEALGGLIRGIVEQAYGGNK